MGRKAEGKDDRNQIKYTMAYDGFAAKLAEVFSKPAYLNEDKAMPEVVLSLIKKDKEHNNLYVLDRGLMALKNYKEFDKNDAVFIGRINTNRKMKVVRSLMTEDTDRDLGKLERYGISVPVSAFRSQRSSNCSLACSTASSTRSLV